MITDTELKELLRRAFRIVDDALYEQAGFYVGSEHVLAMPVTASVFEELLKQVHQS